MKNLAVFASGSGSNFEAIVTAVEKGIIKANLVLLVVDKPDCYCVERAKNHNIEVLAVSLKECESKAHYEQIIVNKLNSLNVDMVALAGYMKIVGETLLSAYGGRIINIHPALLPSFKGAHGIADAFNYGVKVFGVTIHYVNEGVDTGKIIAQDCFKYVEGETVEQVEERIHAIEHVLYVDTLAKLLGNN